MLKSSDIPRLVVSSYRGKAGKTAAVLSLYYSLTKAGHRVSMFKVGPDFVDPSYHEALSGKPSRNLDHLLMGEKVVGRLCAYSEGSDFALVEGVHGLYDSLDGYSEEGSTAQMAKMLKAPVLVVVDGERVNRTAAAIALGLRAFDPEVKFAGVFLTDVTDRQAEKMSKALDGAGIEVLGTLYKDQLIAETMRYRHLGLIHTRETDGSALRALAAARSDIDAARVFAMAKETSERLEYEASGRQPEPRAKPRIGIARGRAFSFYYPETIEEATRLGDVRFFDPETDQGVEADIIIMGGGFPEIYAETLEKNRPMKSFVRGFVERGGILYAECGGLIYLSRRLDYKGSEYDMAGIFDASGTFHDRRVGHGYAWGKLEKDTLLGRRGVELKGHEFHYTELRTDSETAFKYDRGRGINGRDGLTYKNVYAHFMHLHPVTYNFVERLAEKSRSPAP